MQNFFIMQLLYRLNIDWVPTLNLGHGKSATQRVQNAAREARAERSKERRKQQAELQEQERLLKQQKLNEPGIPLADFASEIESSSTEIELVLMTIWHDVERKERVLNLKVRI